MPRRVIREVHYEDSSQPTNSSPFNTVILFVVLVLIGVWIHLGKIDSLEFRNEQLEKTNESQNKRLIDQSKTIELHREQVIKERRTSDSLILVNAEDKKRFREAENGYQSQIQTLRTQTRALRLDTTLLHQTISDQRHYSDSLLQVTNQLKGSLANRLNIISFPGWVKNLFSQDEEVPPTAPLVFIRKSGRSASPYSLTNLLSDKPDASKVPWYMWFGIIILITVITLGIHFLRLRKRLRPRYFSK